MQKNGIVGAGGAGFPSYGKLTDGASLLVINAIECEPLMYTDYTLVKEKLADIVAGAQAIMEFGHIPNAILAIKAYRAKTLGLTDGQSLAEIEIAFAETYLGRISDQRQPAVLERPARSDFRPDDRNRQYGRQQG